MGEGRQVDNGRYFRVSWVVVLAFILGLMGAAYANLDTKKADRDAVLLIQQDVREIRTFLLGPKQ